ncbi:MAG: glycosyltransferase family 2 protein [Clostridia bacterium]|nr:glycosyltransferase family 2 protein [Clostridia bacterium]
MDRSPLVSIIIPVYGTEDYLPGCIESVCGQSYKNTQIILVDDQSPDSCPEICDRYAEQDHRILVIHQENKGVSGARNTGIRHADGDYIMFVDSDDELYPNAVETLLNDAMEYDADVVSATKKVVDENDKVLKSCEDERCTVYREFEPLLLSLGGDSETNSACAKLFRATFFSGIGFEEGQNINEDGYFIFQCYMRKPVLVQHNVSVYQYNVRQSSGSRQAFSDKYLSMLYFCERKLQLIAEHCPQYTEQAYNMAVRTHLQFLDVLCRTTEKKYKALAKESVQTVRRLYRYHHPIHDHHRKLAWITAHGLYPLYKLAVRLKYFR